MKKVKLAVLTRSLWEDEREEWGSCYSFVVVCIRLYPSDILINMKERIALRELCNLRKPFRGCQIDLQLIKLYLFVVSKTRFVGAD